MVPKSALSMKTLFKEFCERADLLNGVDALITKEPNVLYQVTTAGVFLLIFMILSWK